MLHKEVIPTPERREEIKPLGALLAEKKWSGKPLSDQELLEHMARLQIGVRPVAQLEAPTANEPAEPERHLAHVA